MKRALLTLALVAAFAGSATADIHDTRDQLTGTSPAAHALIGKMLAVNPTLKSFTSRVHVDMHTNIPFLSPSLDGTSYYKRPNSFAVIFDRVPSYAKGFSKLFNDVGDPSKWEKECYLDIDGQRQMNGKNMLVMKMTKKQYSDQIDYTLAIIDPQTSALVRMEFYYRNGDEISMDQRFRTEGSYQLVDSQHAEINRSHIRATADATYATYRTNVPVDSSVFVKQ